MRYLILLLLVTSALTNCKGGGSHELTYEELVAYPTNCSKMDEQLKELHALQRSKNFAEDPDALNENDRLYNGRLKATIWWYAYSCN